MQEIIEIQFAAGQHGVGDLLEGIEGFMARAARCKFFMQLAGQPEGFFVALARGGTLGAGDVVVEKMLFKVHDIGRKFGFEGGVIVAPAAEKNDGEAVIRIGPDHLVDPA